MGGADQALVEYEGAREVRRVSGSASVVGGQLLRALPDGGWIAGASRLARDGSTSWSGYAWAQRYGRFGSPKAIAWSPDGAVAVVDGADSPSACLCDRERGTAGSSAGALVRLTFSSEGAPVERVLAEHAGSREYRLAVSRDWIAAAEGRSLTVWPTRGDGEATAVAIDGPGFSRLLWADERTLVATRYLDPERAQIIVLDRTRAYAPSADFEVAGQIADLAIRPGGAELAVALTRYRATDHVWYDERKVEVHSLDGTLRTRVDTAGYPSALAWSPRGDALLVATIGDEPERAVLRYAVR